MVPKGLLTFLGFLGNAEFSPWKRPPEVIKKIAGVFVTASDDLCVCVCGFVWKKNCLCYPRSVDEGLILALIIVSTSMARPTVAKHQGNQCSKYSRRHQRSIGIFFSLFCMKYDIKIQNQAI